MRKGMMFYKIFIPILILGIGLVATLGSYIYISTSNSVIEKVASTKQSYITQIKNNLEQKIRTIEYAFNTYSTTSSFQEVVKNPITEQDFSAYRNVNTQLNYIATMGLEQTQYTLISLEKNWKISDGKLTHLTESDKEALYHNYIKQKDRGLFWTKSETGIRFVNVLPAFSFKKQAIALSDISKQTLDQIIRSDENSDVFILDQQGQLLYETTPADTLNIGAMIPSLLEQDLTENHSGILTLKYKEQSAQILYAKSAYNHWIYFTLLNPHEITEALEVTRYGLVVMALLITLLVIIIAYFTAIHFTKPIQKIKSSLPHNLVAATSTKNEIDWILSSIDHIVTEKESLEHMIEAEMPQLETQFILNLFRNRMSSQEIAYKMPRFGYEHWDKQKYVVMLIQLDSYGEWASSDRDVLLLAVNKLVEEKIQSERRMLPIILNDYTQATILFFDGEEEESRKQILEDAHLLIESAKEYLNLSISIGISSFYTNLRACKEACEMGKQALRYRLNLGKESIIFYEDISAIVTGPVVLYYPKEIESHIFDAIRLGDEQQACELIPTLLEKMRDKNKSSMNFEVMLVRFVNNLIQLEQLLGMEVLMRHDNDALYHRLLGIRNPEEIERMLTEQVIVPMVQSMKEKTNEQFKCLSEKIATIIRSEYDQELSLEMIGERLHYNPNYLSSIFKKEYGTTFSDYLVSYRLEIAKKWLVQGDMTIKEIAERLQYQNSQNFIRSFRKKEQITPGMYRKQKQSQ
ncbi:AraC-like DNA-binding protein [Paenibacillus turicensis]|uniref:AraC-like DNA-binding protein n=1 Tax=Paenibacillus turicensis TaxID=160487 RepID=A0ABS4FYT5_9BACL|nr:helix-turn-helix domain-containing protein [Paenibacillus turicensis]MBP1907744.1 AraC-like DNA-binding protein [Paenibacillus turicensis]